MQICEDSLSFKNFRSQYFIQTASKAKENKMKIQAKQNKMTLQGQHNSCEEAKTQVQPILTDTC